MKELKKNKIKWKKPRNLYQKFSLMSPCVFCWHTGAFFFFLFGNHLWSMAQLHVTVRTATHLYVSSHFIPHGEQMTQLGVSACLTWCEASTGSAGGHVSTWQSSRLEAPLSALPFLLSSISFCFACFLPANCFHVVANPLKVCSTKKSYNCELNATQLDWESVGEESITNLWKLNYFWRHDVAGLAWQNLWLYHNYIIKSWLLFRKKYN